MEPSAGPIEVKLSAGPIEAELSRGVIGHDTKITLGRRLAWMTQLRQSNCELD